MKKACSKSKRVIYTFFILAIIFCITGCSSTSSPVSTEKDGYESVSFDDLLRHSDNYVDKKISVSGKAWSVNDDGSEYATINFSGGSGKDIIVIYKTSLASDKVLDYDSITVYGTFTGYNFTEVGCDYHDTSTPFIFVNDDTDEIIISTEN